MENLEKALTREHNRIQPEQIKRAYANNLNDIKIIISEFDPASNPPLKSVAVNATINVVDDNLSKSYSINSVSKSLTKRERIINGLDIIKNRIAAAETIGQIDSVVVNGRVMCPLPITSSVDCVTDVDMLIRDWFGGYRDGILICWDISDGYTYRYDIYNHKLTRVKSI